MIFYALKLNDKLLIEIQLSALKRVIKSLPVCLLHKQIICNTNYWSADVEKLKETKDNYLHITLRSWFRRQVYRYVG